MLTACAAPLSPDETRFRTRITDDGGKLFELVIPPPQRPPMAPANAAGAPRHQGWSDRDKARILEQVLAASEYCREGYLLLGRWAGENVQRLRGECREKATAEDRELFPDTITRW